MFGLQAQPISRAKAVELCGDETVRRIIREHPNRNLIFWLTEIGAVCVDIYRYEDTILGVDECSRTIRTRCDL